MRLVAVLALLVPLAACDRKPAEAPQANAAAAVAPAPEVELAGKLDMTHRGEPAPAMAFRDSQDKPLRIAAFRGTPVLVNLWATWCGPCVRELPSLDRLAVKAAGRLAIVAVNQDSLTSDPHAYWEERNFSQLALYTDPKTALSAAYATGTLPTTVLYDAKGKEVWRIVGGLEWDGPRANTLLSPVIG